eukprot:scaffold11617_cov130-Isochrysis_galbana.AAC.5
MAPRQLLLELEEVEMAAEKGSKRVRADSTNENSLFIAGGGTKSSSSSLTSETSTEDKAVITREPSST